MFEAMGPDHGILIDPVQYITLQVTLQLSRHVDPVHGGVTLAAHAAHVDVVGPHLVREVGLVL